MENLQNVRTLGDICAACKVSREAVRQWRELGMPAVKISARLFVYDGPAVLQWLEERLPERAAQLRAAEAAREAAVR